MALTETNGLRASSKRNGFHWKEWLPLEGKSHQEEQLSLKGMASAKIDIFQ